MFKNSVQKASETRNPGQQKFSQGRSVGGPADFHDWLPTRNSNRNVKPEILLALINVEDYICVRELTIDENNQCFRLPAKG